MSQSQNLLFRVQISTREDHLNTRGKKNKTTLSLHFNTQHKKKNPPTTHAASFTKK
jgi:hypothetical protein